MVWLKVLSPGELAEGGVRSVACAGRALCMVKTGGKFAALDDACPHQGAPLGDGWIEDGLLICPRHAWAFDPFRGALWASDVQEIQTYQVQERDDGVYVALPDPRNNPQDVPDFAEIAQLGFKKPAQR